MKVLNILESCNLKTNRENAITLIALVITIIVLLILSGVTIATITGENGLLSKAQLAKERTLDAEQDEKDKLSSYENEIDSYVGGNRDYETEISNLQAQINSLKETINNLQYHVITSSSVDVEYNKSKMIYTKEFSEDKLICYTTWANYDSNVSNGTFNYGIFVRLNGNTISSNRVAEIKNIDSNSKPTISQVLSVKKGDKLEFGLYQAGESGKSETINIGYDILGNW